VISRIMIRRPKRNDQKTVKAAAAAASLPPPKWTEEYLDSLVAAGKIRSYRITAKGRAPVTGDPDPGPAPEKKNKFGNTRTTYNGHKFQSVHEAEVYKKLLLRERAGEIKDLRLQVSFELNEEGAFSYRYIADFTYIEVGTDTMRVVDAKGAKTGEYLRKRRLMAELLGIEIVEL
jgi:hypothetical protein